MPLYEYQCQECGEVTEVLVSGSGKPDVTCEKCGSKKVDRKFSTFSARIASGGSDTGSSCPTGTCPLS